MSKDSFPAFALHADAHHGSTEPPSWGHSPGAKVAPASELKEIIPAPERMGNSTGH